LARCLLTELQAPPPSSSNMLSYIRQTALSSLLLGLVSCAPAQSAKSPEPPSPAREDGTGAPVNEGATPPEKTEKQGNDGSGSASPLPESKNEQAVPPAPRADAEQWSQVNLLCGPSPRRDAATRWP
jgi:hypothetical protein